MHYEQGQSLENKMENLPENPSISEIWRLMEAFVEFGISFDEYCEDLPDTWLLGFTRKNKEAAQKICGPLLRYFLYAYSAIYYVYEDAGEAECKLAEICMPRSGVEYFIEFFECRLRELDSKGFDDWYKGLGLSGFDERLREKISRDPIRHMCSIPKNIPETHWWWNMPHDW